MIDEILQLDPDAIRLKDGIIISHKLQKVLKSEENMTENEPSNQSTMSSLGVSPDLEIVTKQYMVTSLVDGPLIETLVCRDDLSSDIINGIIEQITKMHKANWIHLDTHLSNMIYDPSKLRTYLLDFAHSIYGEELQNLLLGFNKKYGDYERWKAIDYYYMWHKLLEYPQNRSTKMALRMIRECWEWFGVSQSKLKLMMEFREYLIDITNCWNRFPTNASELNFDDHKDMNILLEQIYA